MHGGGRAHTQVDQGLRAFLTLHQHHLLGLEQARLVVQRPRIGWRHLSPAHVPRPKLLVTGLRVIAVDHCDELAAGILVVPFGCGRAQLIHWRSFEFVGSCHGRDRSSRDGGHTTEPVAGLLQDLSKLAMHIKAVIAGHQVKDVTAVTRGTISPQACLGAGEQQLQAVAGATGHITDQELVVPPFARWPDLHHQHWQACNQSLTDLGFFLGQLGGIRTGFSERGRCRVVEIKHAQSLPLSLGGPHRASAAIAPWPTEPPCPPASGATRQVGSAPGG